MLVPEPVLVADLFPAERAALTALRAAGLEFPAARGHAQAADVPADGLRLRFEERVHVTRAHEERRGDRRGAEPAVTEVLGDTVAVIGDRAAEHEDGARPADVVVKRTENRSGREDESAHPELEPVHPIDLAPQVYGRQQL